MTTQFANVSLICSFFLLYPVGIFLFLALLKKSCFSTKKTYEEKSALPDPFETFFIFLAAIIIIPFIMLFIIQSFSLNSTQVVRFLARTLITITSVLLLLKIIVPVSYRHIVGKKHFYAMWQGFLWALAIAWIIFSLYIISRSVIQYFTNIPPPQQEALMLLKQHKDTPVLYGVFIFAITTWLPIYEELIFRGLIQNLLLLKLRPTIAIALTSAIFALFHYSRLQGSDNIAVIISIFCLSLFLGRIYFKERSILAPIALHVTYNSIMLAIFLQTTT